MLQQGRLIAATLILDQATMGRAQPGTRLIKLGGKIYQLGQLFLFHRRGPTNLIGERDQLIDKVTIHTTGTTLPEKFIIGIDGVT